MRFVPLWNVPVSQWPTVVRRLIRTSARRYCPCRASRVLCLVGLALLASSLGASEPSRAEQGYDVLRTRAFLPADFDDEVFDALWTVWPDEQKSLAKKASLEERRQMVRDYYGLVASPDDRHAGQPALGYSSNGRGGWVMNCLSCHGGTIDGVPYAGRPNHRYALETLTEDVRTVKLKLGKKWTHMDLASLRYPLGGSVGTTNSVMFGVILGAHRKPDMTVDLTLSQPPLMHHDMDAPPFWNVRKKTMLYADGFAPKTHRVLMQFMLLPTNSRETVYGWEDDFRAILDWIESVPVPRYIGKIDDSLADQGRAVFEEHCSRCHGTYGPDGTYPQQIVALDDVGTDPLRFQALTVEHREWMKQGWMSRYGEDEVNSATKGYVAPPLDGIWASAPYFHNGSVPTLWHVLHPDDRPVVWRMTGDALDDERMGLRIDTFDEVPESAKSAGERRRYFDTRKPGKSAAGHRYPDALSEDQKRALLEYLKSL